MSEKKNEEIREARLRGELLGPLCDKYGADAVVRALGVHHVSCSLGVAADPDDRDEFFDEEQP